MRSQGSSVGAAPLERRDGGRVPEGEGDLVLAARRPSRRKGSTVNGMRVPSGPMTSGREVHGDLRARHRVEAPRSAPAASGATTTGKHPHLEAVVEEDVAEGRRDDRADPVGGERPDRVLPRGAAAEVVGGDEDARGTKRGLIEDEVRPFPAVLVEAHVVEEEPRVLRPPGPMQESRGDDAVGIDVHGIEWHRRRGERGEGLHPQAPATPSVRTSVSRPVTAAAAAIAGLMRWVRTPLP